MSIIYVEPFTFRPGDVIKCWDEEINKSVIGYIVETSRNKEIGDFDITIRWIDPFIVMETCSSVDLHERVSEGPCKHYGMTNRKK
jgi:hypothetical protein